MTSRLPQLPPLARNLLALLAFLAVGAVLAQRASDLLAHSGRPDATHWVMQDFRDVVYFPARAFLEGHNPYDTGTYVERYPVWHPLAMYTPLTLVVHAPFGALPFEIAWPVYVVYSLLLLAVLAVFALRVCGLRSDPWRVLWILTALLVSRPGYMNTLLGQVGHETALAVSIALYCSRTRPWIAAAALAVSTYKPSFGALLGFLLLCRGDTQVVLRGALLAALVTMPPLLRLIQIAGSPELFVSSLQSTATAFGSEQFDDPVFGPFRVDTAALIARLSNWHMDRGEELVVGGAILLISGACLWWWRAADGTDPRRRLTGTWISLVMLAATYHQTYDLLLLTIPAVGLCVDRWRPQRWQSRWTWGLLVTGLGLFSVNYLATATAIDVLDLNGRLRLLVTSINPALVAAFLLLYFRLTWRQYRIVTTRG